RATPGALGFAGHAADLAARYAANQARAMPAIWARNRATPCGSATIPARRCGWPRPIGRSSVNPRCAGGVGSGPGRPATGSGPAVLDFLARSGLQDARLAPLVAALAGGAR
ncbi:hypothetical protein, partial [Methylomagnum ishizawai]|uniref:hypothetical protein n=1 Tax=Methylomagnum ishizawai TaxID=1760988 RepID=UPI001C391218